MNMVSVENNDLRALADRPFHLLLSLEQRLSSRLARSGGAEGADAWVGLGFSMGEDNYLAPQREVREVITVPAFTRIPNAKPWLMGIANVRGSLLPLIDLRQLIDGEASPISRTSRFMVLNSDEIPAGFLVDAVSGYRRFASLDQRHDLAAESPAGWRDFLLGAFVREHQAFRVFSFMKLATSDIFQNASA